MSFPYVHIYKLVFTVNPIWEQEVKEYISSFLDIIQLYINS